MTHELAVTKHLLCARLWAGHVTLTPPRPRGYIWAPPVRNLGLSEVEDVSKVTPTKRWGPHPNAEWLKGHF